MAKINFLLLLLLVPLVVQAKQANKKLAAEVKPSFSTPGPAIRNTRGATTTSNHSRKPITTGTRSRS